MSKSQIAVLFACILLFLGLYFGGSLKPKEIKSAEKVRKLEVESTDINSMLLEAKPSLNPQEVAEIMSLETRLEQTNADSTKASVYKDLASSWYRFNKSALSAYYAEKVAEIEQSEEAWSITGTSYVIALKKAKTEKIKKFSSKRAIKAFENAISLNPDNMQHQTNLAVCYAEFPPADNPMKGILMLLDLNKRNPENVGVNMALARFGMQTNQFDKVQLRLENVLNIEPNNLRANCLMAEVLEKKGNLEGSKRFSQKCESLRKSEF